jgi:ubiquinone/menaquinone biosynthesis C-methylase UbiE
MSDPKQTYFDELAARWDGFTNHDRVRSALRSELGRMRIAKGEHIVDLGCGTGNLTAVLLDLLGQCGHITAVDFSPQMIDCARAKFPDPRVTWLTADAASLPLDDGSCDRIICFSAWPHFPHPATVLKDMHRILRGRGTLTVLHIDGRETINHVHAHASEAVKNDILHPACDLSALFTSCGFSVEECDESDSRYVVTGRKP